MAEASQRLFLLDGMALVYRAHFALIRSPIYTTARFNTSAIYGFTTTLLDLLEKQKPTHIAVVFDTPEPTPRHEIYPPTRRSARPCPRTSAGHPGGETPHPRLRHPRAGVPRLRGRRRHRHPRETRRGRGRLHLLHGHARQGFRPACQRNSTLIYKPGRQGSAPEILDVAAIREQWLVERPEQVIDVLGLWGDASDNIPGVPGVGEKTAKNSSANGAAWRISSPTSTS
jgi:DNA polymerase-1